MGDIQNGASKNSVFNEIYKNMDNMGIPIE